MREWKGVFCGMTVLVVNSIVFVCMFCILLINSCNYYILFSYIHRHHYTTEISNSYNTHTVLLVWHHFWQCGKRPTSMPSVMTAALLCLRSYQTATQSCLLSPLPQCSVPRHCCCAAAIKFPTSKSGKFLVEIFSYHVQCMKHFLRYLLICARNWLFCEMY